MPQATGVVEHSVAANGSNCHGVKHLNITSKEFIPIVLAVAIWGHQWTGKIVLAVCDNEAVVSIVNSGTSKDKEAMHLHRCLAFTTAKFTAKFIFGTY